MSDGFAMQLGLGPNTGFIIKNICGCRIVFGQVPASEFSMLTHGFSKKAKMDINIADKIGALFVIGEPDDLEELRQMDLPVSEKRQADYQAASQLGLPKVASWLRDGERGASSNAMCKRIFGIPADAGANHPHDPADLRRCLMFLDATDAHDKVALMSGVSGEWQHLVSRWDELVVLFEEEVAGDMAALRQLLARKFDVQTQLDRAYGSVDV